MKFKLTRAQKKIVRQCTPAMAYNVVSSYLYQQLDKDIRAIVKEYFDDSPEAYKMIYKCLIKRLDTHA